MTNTQLLLIAFLLACAFLTGIIYGAGK